MSLAGPTSGASETGPASAAFAVTRVGDLSVALVVFFDINPASNPAPGFSSPPATLGTDYTLQAGTITIPPGSTSGAVTIPSGSPSATITVIPIDDSIPESIERVTIELKPKPFYLFGSSGTVASVGIEDNDRSTVSIDNQIEPDERVAIELIGETLLPDPSPYLMQPFAGTASVLLKDNDTNVVAVVAADANASESGPDPASFKIIRTGSLAAALTAVYTLSGVATHGQDYNPLSGSVVIPAGQASVVVEVTPIKDQQIEDAESVILTLKPSSAYTLGSQQTATVIIAGN